MTTLFLVVGLVITAGGTFYLVGSLFRSIQDERRSSNLQRLEEMGG